MKANKRYAPEVRERAVRMVSCSITNTTMTPSGRRSNRLWAKLVYIQSFVLMERTP